MRKSPATIDVLALPDESTFYNGLASWLSPLLPSYLPDKRWYGDKAKTIVSAEVTQVVPVTGVGRPAALAIVTVHFSHRETASYLIPVLLSAQNDNFVEPIAELRTDDQSTYIVDGLNDEQFRVWFASSIAGTTATPGIIPDRLPAHTTDFDMASGAPSRLMGVDQSNTSIAFGFDMLVKVIRRLQPGLHPDVELTRFLTARTDFPNVAHYFGSLSLTGVGAETSVIAFAQRFVESTGDGWKFLLSILQEHTGIGEPQKLHARSEHVARTLGDITGRMHLALGSDPWTQDVAPETIKRHDAERWSTEYIALVDRVAADLSDHKERFDPETRELVETFLQLAPGLRKRDAGFFRLIGRSKSRVHGDYHLGQTMRKLDGDFVVIDFEGEPLRAIEERRQKTSPLKDVAGMLRSFSYARGTATGWLTEQSALLPSDLVSWERAMRREFLNAYVSAVTIGGGTFLPPAPEDLKAAIASWELDKAAYEVVYELNNRPDWLWIPLSSMLKQAEPEGTGTTD